MAKCYGTEKHYHSLLLQWHRDKVTQHLYFLTGTSAAVTQCSGGLVATAALTNIKHAFGFCSNVLFYICAVQRVQNFQALKCEDWSYTVLSNDRT